VEVQAAAVTGAGLLSILVKGGPLAPRSHPYQSTLASTLGALKSPIGSPSLKGHVRPAYSRTHLSLCPSRSAPRTMQDIDQMLQLHR